MAGGRPRSVSEHPQLGGAKRTIDRTRSADGADRPGCICRPRHGRNSSCGSSAAARVCSRDPPSRADPRGSIGRDGEAVRDIIGVIAKPELTAWLQEQAVLAAITLPRLTGETEDAFAKRDPKTFTPVEYDRWFCTPYISSIAFQIQQELPGTDVRVIRRVAEGEGQILTRVQTLLWLVTGAALLAAALAVGASSAASVIERRTEIGLMKALGAGSGTVGFLLAAEQLLLAFVGGGAGYAIGIILARLLGERIFGAAPEPSLMVFFVIIALAGGVTILGSALPLRRASRYEPAPILRGE